MQVKPGDLVLYKSEPWMYHDTPDYGIGIVTQHDGHDKYRVLWAHHTNGSRVFDHDGWELTPYEGGRFDKISV